MKRTDMKKVAISLRKQGKTYREINSSLGEKIPKSTLSFWLSKIRLKKVQKERIIKLQEKNLSTAQKAAAEIGAQAFKNRFDELKKSKRAAVKQLANRETAKLILAALFLRTGSARSKNGLQFASADPNQIKLILHLLRFCYNMNEGKFRCTVQCRKGTDYENFIGIWSKITKIPTAQFYKTLIDPRPKGKITGRDGYIGVCRINYLSNSLYWEVQAMSDIFKQ